MSLQSHRPGASLLLARLMMASVFIVMGGYRLLNAYEGVPTSGATLTFSAIELAMGLLMLSDVRTRIVASLGALLMLADALMSHPFWSHGGAAQGAQLLHFMKNIGFAGGLLLLASVCHRGGKRR